MIKHFFKSLILLTASTLLLAPGVNANELTPRIVGGTVVPDNRYPFMVSIYFDLDGDTFFAPGCGGSLVASRWVVTAAHCVVNSTTGAVRSPSEIAVLVGALNLAAENEGELITLNNIIVHPDYNSRTFVSDIALIELSNSVNQIPISLPVLGSDIPIVSEEGIVAGWGHTSEGGVSSNLLREVSLPVLSHAACLPFYQSSLRPEANVCAGGARNGGRDACQGDSGGPLFVARENIWVLAGIVSYGEGCARPGIPGVYTRVSSYTDWVASFVPGLQSVGSAAVSTNDEQAVNSSQLQELTAQAPMQSGSLLTGEVEIFELIDADRVELTSLTGDADLYVFQGVRFENEDVICISDEFTPFDACDLPVTNDRLFAGVYSYEASNYEIRITVASDTNDELTPAGGEVTPVGGEVTPVGGEVTPVGEDVTPVGGEVTPVGEDVTPVGVGVTPVGGEVTPVAEEVTLVGDEVTPVEEVESGNTPSIDPVPANDSDIALSPIPNESGGSMGGLALLLLGSITLIRRFMFS